MAESKIEIPQEIKDCLKQLAEAYEIRATLKIAEEARQSIKYVDGSLNEFIDKTIEKSKEYGSTSEKWANTMDANLDILEQYKRGLVSAVNSKDVAIFSAIRGEALAESQLLNQKAKLISLSYKAEDLKTKTEYKNWLKAYEKAKKDLETAEEKKNLNKVSALKEVIEDLEDQNPIKLQYGIKIEQAKRAIEVSEQQISEANLNIKQIQDNFDKVADKLKENQLIKADDAKLTGVSGFFTKLLNRIGGFNRFKKDLADKINKKTGDARNIFADFKTYAQVKKEEYIEIVHNLEQSIVGMASDSAPAIMTFGESNIFIPGLTINLIKNTMARTKSRVAVIVK